MTKAKGFYVLAQMTAMMAGFFVVMGGITYSSAIEAVKMQFEVIKINQTAIANAMVPAIAKMTFTSKSAFYIAGVLMALSILIWWWGYREEKE